MMKKHLLALFASAALLLGCASPEVQDYAAEKPVLALEKYFNGELVAHEIALLGHDHVEMGTAVARRWHFPEAIVRTLQVTPRQWARLDGRPAELADLVSLSQELLAPLEARLSLAPCLGGDTPCATDLALMPFVRQFAAVDPAWFDALPLPSLQRWLKGWLAHPLFLACMAPLPAEGVHRFPSP